MKTLKRILVLIVITVMLIMITGCEKLDNDLHCYKCLTILDKEVIMSAVTCGMTEENIEDFKQGLKTMAIVTYGIDVEVICTLK